MLHSNRTSRKFCLLWYMPEDKTGYCVPRSMCMKKTLSSFSFFIIFLLFLTSCSQQDDDKKDAQLKDSLPRDLKELNVRILEEPDNPALYNQRANVYLGKKDMEAAQADINRAMKIDSSRGEFYVTQANIYFVQQQPGKAKRAF